MNEIANYFRLNIVKMKEVKIRGWYRAKKKARLMVLSFFVFIYTKICNWTKEPSLCPKEKENDNMRVSKMGMKNVKLSNLDEMYPAQDILIQTNQVKQYGSRSICI